MVDVPQPTHAMEMTCPACHFQWYLYDPMKPLGPLHQCPRCKTTVNLKGRKTDPPAHPDRLTYPDLPPPGDRLSYPH